MMIMVQKERRKNKRSSASLWKMSWLRKKGEGYLFSFDEEEDASSHQESRDLLLSSSLMAKKTSLVSPLLERNHEDQGFETEDQITTLPEFKDTKKYGRRTLKKRV